MDTKTFQLSEEVVFKKGTRRCSGRIRDGKFLYYLPDKLKKDLVKNIIQEIRQNLLCRLQQAYQYHDYLTRNLSEIDEPEQLYLMAKQIYLRKYPILDFPLTLKFRRQKTVMGTYRRSKKGEVTIYINDYFKKAPQFLLEYIIAHELSHHHFWGHDKNFYRELAKMCTDHETKRKLASHYLILKEAKIF